MDCNNKRYQFFQIIRPANLRLGNWVRFENGATFAIVEIRKLVKIGEILSLFLALEAPGGSLSNFIPLGWTEKNYFAFCE